jgi:hypothetical protein
VLAAGGGGAHHPRMADFTTPNLFHLHGHGVHVNYSTTGLDGKPSLSYQDSHGASSFHGDQITHTATPIGMLVTVALRTTVDAGGTTFSVLLPRVNLMGPSQSVAVHTEGFTTVQKLSVVPAFNHGQTQIYTPIALQGTAAFAVF